MKWLFIFIIGLISFNSCSTNSNVDTDSDVQTDDVVEVLYFHGKQRCITCNAIENLAKEVVLNDFAQQVKDGTVVMKIIDISTKDGEKIADKYEVSWSSLFINKWNDGIESKNNMTEFGFSYAKNSPDVFKDGVKKKIDELLK